MVDSPSPTDARERILDAAERVFAAQGLAGARVAAIAEAAGVNKAMLYYYFGSKEGLFEAVLGRVAAALETLAQTSLGASALPPEARVRAFLEGYRALVLSRPVVVRMVLWDVLDGGQRLLKVARPVFQQVVPFMWRACAEGQALGSIRRDVDPRFVLPTLIAPYLLLALAGGFLEENIGLSFDEIREPFQRTALALSLEGLLARPEPS